MANDFKETLDTMNKQMETLTREMYAVKQNQVKILEMKNTIPKISEFTR